MLALLHFRERETALGQSGLPPIQPNLAAQTSRFTGGGFNVKSKPSKPRIVQ